MAMRGPRLQVGTSPWVAEERSCALQIAQSEVEEFSYSARNEMEWLNEHMAGIFKENETSIAEAFKTPGKLRGKTPRTTRKANPSEARIPLTDVFASTPNGSTNHFAQQLSRVQSPRGQENMPRSSPSPAKSAARKQNLLSPKLAPPAGQSQDSGYYGSQDMISQHAHLAESFAPSQQSDIDRLPYHTTPTVPINSSPVRTVQVDSPTKTFQTAREDQTTRVLPDTGAETTTPRYDILRNVDEDVDMAFAAETSPAWKRTPVREPSDINDRKEEPVFHDTPQADEIHSPSDASSPVRPVVRKSSLNFAPLPAREPMTAVKNNGDRVSRISQFDHNATGYNSRTTGEKSLGNLAQGESEDGEEADHDEMEIDEQPAAQITEGKVNPALNHNKTYTQRLQDQINMLGKGSSGSRPSKSIPNIAALKHNMIAAPALEASRSPSPKRISPTKSTPGAFPEDEDDWIDPPALVSETEQVQSPRPAFSKSHTADIMQGIHSSSHVGAAEFSYPSLERMGRSISPVRAPASSGKHNPGLGHMKSSSVSAVPLMARQVEKQTLPLTKAATVSNAAMATVAEMGTPQTPSKSPSRSFRDSPLKQIKNKMSSILKSSKGLLVSGAAISAEGKAAMLSSSPSRLALHAGPSTDSVIPKPSFESQRSKMEPPPVPIARTTRASTEREKEEKRREKEASKEAKRMEEQMDKLEKAREKEREKARVFSKEQEKIAALVRQISVKKDEERLTVKEALQPLQSPRKAQDTQDSEDRYISEGEDMADAPSTIPLSSAPRSAGPAQSARGKEIKRPVRPTKDTQAKAKQAPTVIRVNTGSQQSKYQPVTGGSLGSEPETVALSGSQPPQLASKASKATIQTKSSVQSLKGAAAGRPKALDLAAKKKEQDEREAQRRREVKAELERKRAIAQEEQRRQDQRRQEVERQKQKDREQAAAHAQAEAKQRQALIEKAKQTRAPPPAPRPKQSAHPDHSSLGNSTSSNQSRPPSRMNSGVHAVLSNASKAGMKRTLGQDGNADFQAQRPVSRAGPSYQAKDAKRRRTSQDHDELGVGNPPNIKGPPVRPSAGFRKELPKKSTVPNGYTNAPPGATQNLFRTTVTAQHNSNSKAARPLDLAQISKGAIPFAPNPNAHKTPARPLAVNGAKSTVKQSANRSSPRFQVQHGEAIELPEIQTDDEDDDEDEAGPMVAAWADSPEIRRALMRQETIDPSQIFGPPTALNMEEVFSKSKDRWHKFRARTSSANWSGQDRLTEDDIRKDMAARDKLRREGGWSYEMGKDLI